MAAERPAGAPETPRARAPPPRGPGGVTAAWPLPGPRQLGKALPAPPRPARAPRAPEVPEHLRAPRRGSPRPSRSRGAGGSPAGERPGQGGREGGAGSGQARLHRRAFPARRRFRERPEGGIQVRTPRAVSPSLCEREPGPIAGKVSPRPGVSSQLAGAGGDPRLPRAPDCGTR